MKYTIRWKDPDRGTPCSYVCHDRQSYMECVRQLTELGIKFKVIKGR